MLSKKLEFLDLIRSTCHRVYSFRIDISWNIFSSILFRSNGLLARSHLFCIVSYFDFSLRCLKIFTFWKHIACMSKIVEPVQRLLAWTCHCLEHSFVKAMPHKNLQMYRLKVAIALDFKLFFSPCINFSQC